MHAQAANDKQMVQDARRADTRRRHLIINAIMILTTLLLIGLYVLLTLSSAGITTHRYCEKIHIGMLKSDIVKQLRWFTKTKAQISSLPEIAQIGKHPEFYQVMNYRYLGLGSEDTQIYIVYDKHNRVVFAHCV